MQASVNAGLGPAIEILQHVFRDIRRELPQSEIVMMPGLGHFPSDEKPEEFLAIVDRFLADPPAR